MNQTNQESDSTPTKVSDSTLPFCPVCGLTEAQGLLHVREDVALQHIAKAAADLFAPYSHFEIPQTVTMEVGRNLQALRDALMEFYNVPVESTPTINLLLQMERELAHGD
jgi:hypothetical protein